MPVQFEQKPELQLLEVDLTGKLQKADYDFLMPKIESMIEREGKLRLLVKMHDFHGWTAGAVWEDLKFDVRHFDDFNRIAFVGDRKWEKGMSAFCRPFTGAEIKFFPASELAEARSWLLEEQE